MEIQFKNPKRFISLVLGLSLAMAGTVGLPASADAQSDAIAKIVLFADDDASAVTPTDTDYNAATGEGLCYDLGPAGPAAALGNPRKASSGWER